MEAKNISFYVADHGCGIADNEKEKVFERFYSGDPSRTDRNHYGLGLSIAQEVIKIHRGNIILNLKHFSIALRDDIGYTLKLSGEKTADISGGVFLCLRHKIFYWTKQNSRTGNRCTETSGLIRRAPGI